MTRSLRLEFSGALYHVTARGDEGQDICLSDDNLCLFLEVLDGALLRFHRTIHACGLMSNQDHLLVETPEANLSPSKQDRAPRRVGATKGKRQDLTPSPGIHIGTSTRDFQPIPSRPCWAHTDHSTAPARKAARGDEFNPWGSQ